MKIVRLAQDYELTAFEYRGTVNSRKRLRQMAFCKSVEDVNKSDLWVVSDGDRYFIRPHDWIIVAEGMIIDVRDADEFKERYVIVGEDT